MGRQIIDLTHNKNKILLLTYILRCLPIVYINTLGKSDVERQELRNIIVLLKRSQFITTRRALYGLSFLSITKKGYDYINLQLLKGEGKNLYQHEPSRVLRQHVSEHGFMNFLSLWHFIDIHPTLFTKSLRIYDDSNMTDCKIKVYAYNRFILISPDVMILSQKKDTVYADGCFIENDTGRETYRVIYQKLIEYALLVEKGMQTNKLSSIHLHFITKSKRRSIGLLSEKGIVSFFKTYNSTNHITDIREKVLLSAFSNPAFSFSLSYLTEENEYRTTPFLLHKKLLERNPTWNIYQ